MKGSDPGILLATRMTHGSRFGDPRVVKFVRGVFGVFRFCFFLGGGICSDLFVG